jgi:hypothetical protein
MSARAPAGAGGLGCLLTGAPLLQVAHEPKFKDPEGFGLSQESSQGQDQGQSKRPLDSAAPADEGPDEPVATSPSRPAADRWSRSRQRRSPLPRPADGGTAPGSR